MRIRISKLLMVTAVSLISTACGVTTKGGHTYIDGHCVTCLNNPITGEAYNYNKAEHPRNLAYRNQSSGNGGGGMWQDTTQYLEGKIRFTVRRPVDTTYIRIKREFGFLTRDEKLSRMYIPNASEWLKHEGSFRYEALPGVSYHMRHYVTHRYKGVNREHTIDAVIEKNGSASDVTLTYWVDNIPRSQLNAYGRSLKSRALRAVR